MRKFLLLFICLLALIVSLIPSLSSATTEYARQTGFKCNECHAETTGGGKLTKEGEEFRDDLKIKGLYRPLSKTQKIVRFIIGYIHLFFAIAWFGTILYVHILLKPAYASKGLPKGELLLGWFSIIILAITGALLTIARIPAWKVFYTTRFGILLSIKIILFLIMVSTAVIVTLYIGPMMRKKWRIKEKHIPESKKDMTDEELHSFDGKEGRPAYVAYKGLIYDVTASKLWKSGSHAAKHLAGHDMTDALKTAPHGEEKIMSMPQTGKLIPTPEKPATPFYEKLFYFFAYLNLVLVFLIVFVIALWRWG
ncbi:MAG: cytochrome B5 [Nitrospirae bacterium CG02_land_8_20_14_3_00_44_33]|nr:MAG: cytochrome B5 [Nitrospirae bacterium CG02_land_8_20_14_3_00_44_33]